MKTIFSQPSMLRFLFLGLLVSCMGTSQLMAQSVLCPGDSLIISLSGQRGTIQWESSGDGLTWSPMVGQNAASLRILPQSDAWYRACVTDGTCPPVYSDTSQVTISGLQADAGPDASVCLGSAVTLGGNPAAIGGTPPYLYNWSPANGLSNPALANPSATPTVNTTYQLTVTDADGCTATDDLAVDTSGQASSDTMVFAFTGQADTFIVPPCVSQITIEALGAGAGTSVNGNYLGGWGAQISGDFMVNPGDTLIIAVGGRGGDDPYTSGGGGGSGVSFNNVPMIVAGGGGGVDQGNPNYVGKHGTTTSAGVNGASGGAGGTAGADGTDNAYQAINIARGGRGINSGPNGSTGQDGLTTQTTFTLGTFGMGGGGGSVCSGACNCGGGGGGYSGGGAGGINNSAGGGGSFNSGANQTNSGGIHAGDGQVTISW